MEGFNFEKVINAPEIIKVKRLVETFFVTYHRAPKDMKIDIVQYSDTCFYGICNYGIWGPDQMTAYKSIHQKSSVVDALNDALRGIQTFDSASIPNELIFWVADDNAIYDGNGDALSIKEAHKRRAKNKAKFSKVEWTQALINRGPWWLVSKNFSTKKFSITGPVNDDAEFVHKAVEIKEQGVDFRVETIPITRQTKDEIIDYLVDKFQLQLVSEDEMYKM